MRRLAFALALSFFVFPAYAHDELVLDFGPDPTIEFPEIADPVVWTDRDAYSPVVFQTLNQSTGELELILILEDYE